MSHEPPSDQALIAAINAGDPRAFETLYLRYRSWVAALAYRTTGDRDLALDVTQEAFLYLLRKFPGFTLTAQLKTFLYPAVRHLAIAAAQKTRRRTGAGDAPLADLPAPVPGNSNPENPARSETHENLLAVLARLPEGQREVLMLRFADDLPLAEIAAALGLPLGTVKSRLSLALGSLRADPQTKQFFETR